MDQVKIRRLSPEEEKHLVKTIYGMLVGLSESDAMGIIALLQSAVERNLIVVPRLQDRLRQDEDCDRT